MLTEKPSSRELSSSVARATSERAECTTVVVTCIDYRIQEPLNAWLTDAVGRHDRIALAGATYDVGTVVGQLCIAKRLHDVQWVYLVNHEDCQRYKNSPKTPEEDVAAIQARLRAIHPDMSIHSLFVALDGRLTMDEVARG
jgi:carbonic anhydrase